VSPWEVGTGFRLDGAPVVRLALELGGERHWLRVARRPSGLSISLAGHWHEVELHEDPSGRIAGEIDRRPVSATVELADDATIVRRQCLRFELTTDTGAEHHASAEHEGHLRAPMPGHVLDVRTTVGAEVAAGAVLVLLEAMKMEHGLVAPWAGKVAAVSVKPGDRVAEGAELVLLEPLEAPQLRQPAAQD
jgi:3-methylcrotonyl-CoA carboxylase alpha subunit